MTTRICVLAFFPWIVFGQSGARGFAPETWEKQRVLEEKLKAIPEAARIRQYAKRMSAEPHHAGSPGSREVAEYALGLLKEWGLEARIEKFEALLPYPKEVVVEMTAPHVWRAKLAEPALPEDKDSGDANQLPVYNAYSASGEVTAPLVYVNYGIPEDYEKLRKLGVDVKGKIVIARYGKSWRGTKPKVAAENGAAGCIIYSDPREDGFFQGDVYPSGRYRPPDGVQRGSVLDMPLYVGDPLTPGWASEPGARRLARSEAATLMKIPVVPMSYADAGKLMRQLGGAVVPEDWRGAMGFTYHVGPGPAVVHMRTDFDWATRPLYDVIATIPGAESPDEWVIYGNHHDAWVNGASDPVSGAASLLESARTLAELRKTGWQPRRSILFALWDGEEFGLIGSTEWVEKHQAELVRNAVVYLNSDSTGKGRLAAGGVPSLEVFVNEVLASIPAPDGQGTLAQVARGKVEALRLGSLGAGSDYVAFLDHAGVASLNVGFSSDSAGIYHSIYDSFEWYRKFSDGDYRHGRTLSTVTAVALARLAGADLIPMEFAREAQTLEAFVADIRRQVQAAGGMVDFRALDSEIVGLGAAAREFEAAYRQAVIRMAGRPASELNRAIYRTERVLTDDRGLPGRPWYKHRIYAPGIYTGYSAKTLPAVREAVELGHWTEAAAQAKETAKAVRALRARIAGITRSLKAAR